MTTATNGWTLRNLLTWSGLAVSAAALAGMTVQAPTPDSDAPKNGARPTAAAPPCEPGEGAARASGPAASARRDPHSLAPEEAAELDRLLQAAAVPQQAPSAGQPQTVPVVFHVVSHPDGTGDVPQEVIDKQIRVLTHAFRGYYGGVDTGFRFELEETTRTENARWFADFTNNEDEIKQHLHRGGSETLNIYSLDMGRGLLGRASFPQDYQSDPEGDGVVIDYRTVPGGSLQNFNLGHTATHETGHWLGLFHTFQNGCANPGDYVSDTPYEREQAVGCPEGRDTCPLRKGRDPVHNYMNYSHDPCLNEFTEGQAERMAMSWAAFRE
ncbi:zinc metalloprotease [Actinorugispora endophytica]|uniref:Pregnancy-associated plasma protein-A n=1 Tax=Actinorugispora endophytica TaxID=1605990 RepID=A0A4R6UHX3_9ACTN|nr:zinc metalloprotease [Actinorugispora endophytica]TDQ44585.1 pregnancy-associated plasma protein-A [Actinorugispora endophytica]